MNLVERVKAILLQPKSEWPVIAREPGDAGYLFTELCLHRRGDPAGVRVHRQRRSSATGRSTSGS